jgi:hypothetical protein
MIGSSRGLSTAATPSSPWAQRFSQLPPEEWKREAERRVETANRLIAQCEADHPEVIDGAAEEIGGEIGEK